jgi:very-short-patch-repair endonuclease
MDYLMLLSHYHRVVVEVDGKQHYADSDTASPQEYAEMVCADREPKLAGYDVYRFGGAELFGPDAENSVFSFFNQLFTNYQRA